MKKDYFKNNWRKLDNAAKIFSMDKNKNSNVFRYSVILKQNINKTVLTKALNKSLEHFKAFKVKLGSGMFWNYLEYNKKTPIIKKEEDIPCKHIDFKRNNNYLFKITYYKNKINLDINHILTDGAGAKYFLKSIIYNYLSIKHKLKYIEPNNNLISYQDEYLKNYNKKIKIKNKIKLAYNLPGKINKNINNTYHYIVDLLKVKSICKENQVTITEYITALYVYAIYLTMEKKHNNKKEIIVTIPIDLRKRYNVNTLSNFFVCANINPQIKKNKITTFKEILNQIHYEFQNNIETKTIQNNLTRDVKLGTNLIIRLVPLQVKKSLMNIVFGIVNKTSTTTLSNVGTIDIENKYKKYIDNILLLVMPNKTEKIKCSVCSYENKLNITINSRIDDTKFEQTFFDLLNTNINTVLLETNKNQLK